MGIICLIIVLVIFVLLIVLFFVNNVKLKVKNISLLVKDNDLENEIEGLNIEKDRIDAIKKKFKQTNDISISNSATKKDVEKFYRSQLEEKKENKSA